MSGVQLTDEEIAYRLDLLVAVRTPKQRVRNDILEVRADCVRLKSERTGNPREIPFRDLRQADKASTHGVIVRVLARILGLYAGPEMTGEDEPEEASEPLSRPVTRRFDEVLEAVAQLSLEDQESLLEIMRRRLHAQRRAALVKEVEEARHEFVAGQCQERTPEEIIREALS